MKKAFSLIELLIVILIIGVVYTLSIGNLQKMGDDSNDKLTLENLKEYLQGFDHDRSVKLLCLDDCLECNIFVDGKKVKGIDSFLDSSVKIYRYEFYAGIHEKSQEVYFTTEDVEEDVCFSYAVDKKGVGNQVIVEFKNRVYDFSTYLSSTPIYNSLDEAQEAKESLFREVLQ